MPTPRKTAKQWMQEVEELRARLAERDAQLADCGTQLADARELLRAIRENEVEALVVSTPAGQRVFTRQGADRAKSEFLTNMSHELRTPMNAILGMIDVALPKATDPIVQDCLQTAKGSADLLLTLLNDLLDSAKIESRKLELNSAAFSLRRMLDQLTRVLAARASEKGLSFRCHVADETPDALLGDRMRLQQVLLNLAGNAIKFTERGEVEIRVQSHVGGSTRHEASGQSPAVGSQPSTLDCVHLEFAVRDTGIGIAPADRERLFLPFVQVDASMSRRFGGTGLGLAICKSLVEMMDGRIWVGSQADQGSTFHFTVRLPLAKDLPPDFESLVPAPAVPHVPLRILLVEDNPANQKLATYVLQDRGHTVDLAGDGQEAVHLAQRNRYDVILMDVQMPGMDGLEATGLIRQAEAEQASAPSLSSRLRRVPIIAMTAHAMPGDCDRCLAAGMDAYLSKPINTAVMIGLVESLTPSAPPLPATPPLAATSPVLTPEATAAVFDQAKALKRCGAREHILRDMIGCFFDDVDSLFPQMRTALQQSDLTQVGRLGHRLKGTVVYLAAQRAEESARRVERFGNSHGGAPAEAEQAIQALEQECRALKAALTEYLAAVAVAPAAAQ